MNTPNIPSHVPSERHKKPGLHVPGVVPSPGFPPTVHAKLRVLVIYVYAFKDYIFIPFFM